MIALSIWPLALVCGGLALGQQDLDVILVGGRVIDPQSQLDAIRNVGIRDESIVAISAQPLASRLRVGGSAIEVKGLVVAPGFIDLHAHGQSDDAFRYRVHDGVTTALELEWGYPRISEWVSSRTGGARIHYGASASHPMLRALAMSNRSEIDSHLDEFNRAAVAAEPLKAFQRLRLVTEARYKDLPEVATERLFQLLDEQLRRGAIGIGMAPQYYPGASRREIYRVFQFAAKRNVPIFVHVRQNGLAAMQEVIANAAATGASLHIVHINSMGQSELPEILQLIADARRQGLDVSTETYPYTAGSTSIDSAGFDEGWREKFGLTYSDLQWQDTGERLTEKTFRKYREQGGTVIIHMMKEETIELALKTPFVIIASDAMPYARGAHPRSAGAFAKVLGHYVRERGLIDLMLALKKMTILPAQRLEGIVPAMKNKGRVQIGADADLVVFDPDTIIDTATYQGGLSFSKGIRHVLVSGTFVMRDGKLVEGSYPGKPVLGGFPNSSIR